MADFYSFRDLANALQGGLRNQGNPNLTYSVGNSAGDAPIVHAALERAGRRFEDHFRDRFAEAGPGWPALEDSTIEERMLTGVGGADPLVATYALMESITSEVGVGGGGAMELQVGVENKRHHHENGGSILMEDLMVIHELGNSDTSWHGVDTEIPPRPVFSHPSFADAQARIVAQFAAEVFGTVAAADASRALGGRPATRANRTVLKWTKQ